MRRLKYAAIYLIIFIGLVLFFAPKIYFYYALEEQLHGKNVTISEEKVYDKGFTLAVNDGKVYYDDLVVGTFETLSVLPLILFNHVSIENFAISKDMSRFAKGKIEKVTIVHHIISPQTLHLSAHGDMGEVTAEVNTQDRNISLLLIPSKSLLKLSPFWLRKLKKTDEGGYLYETAY